MKGLDYSTSILVNTTAQEAYESINQVTKWWTENVEGHSQKLNDEFRVRFGDIHVSTQRLIELIPRKKVMWLVTDSQINFVEKKHEWTGTRICFEIKEQTHKTEIHFTHFGLVPEIQCYKACSKGWDFYIQESLYKLLTKGKGTPECK